jgi:glycosyltransferase involved in cell wall biosynthesis
VGPNKEIIFISLHRPNRSPSQRYRFEQYLPYLKGHGFSVDQQYLLSAQDDLNFYKKGNFLPKLLILIKSIWKLFTLTYLRPAPAIYFVQRECFMLGTSFFERLFAKKSNLVYDFDDSIWLPTVSDANKALQILKNPTKVNSIIRCARLVITGNQYLAQHALVFNENVSIIPSTIDTDLYLPKSIVPKSTLVIGWSGSFSTIPHFESVLDALIRIQSIYGRRVSFQVIGDPFFVNSLLGITGKQWNSETELSDLHEFDIGIMPLPDTDWTRGKCGMKGLQYMAAGIPTIMSPVGVNTDIIEDGVNGLLAATTEEWVEKLSLLIDSVALRQQLGSLGRRTVEDRYSVQANRKKYLDLFSQLIAE